MTDDEKGKELADSCGEAVLMLLAMPPMLALRAWVAAQVWAWHLTGLLGPAPSLVALVGLVCLASVIHPHPLIPRGDNEPRAAVRIAVHTTTTLLTLLVAWACTFVGYQG